MPYRGDGTWVAEEDSTENRITGLLTNGNPLMRQAVATSTKMANKRGLMNSSIAAGAGTDAAIRSALPIASQDASQTAAKNLSAQGFAQERELQGATSAELQQRDIASREGMLGRTLTSEEGRQTQQIGSTERIAAAGETGETARQTAQISDIARAEREAQAARQSQSLTVQSTDAAKSPKSEKKKKR